MSRPRGRRCSMRRRLFIVLGGVQRRPSALSQGQLQLPQGQGAARRRYGIVNFDAHFDLRPYDMAIPPHDVPSDGGRVQGRGARRTTTLPHRHPAAQQHREPVQKRRGSWAWTMPPRRSRAATWSLFWSAWTPSSTTAATPLSPSARTCSPRPSRPASARRSRWTRSRGRVPLLKHVLRTRKGPWLRHLRDIPSLRSGQHHRQPRCGHHLCGHQHALPHERSEYAAE